MKKSRVYEKHVFMKKSRVYEKTRVYEKHVFIKITCFSESRVFENHTFLSHNKKVLVLLSHYRVRDG